MNSNLTPKQRIERAHAIMMRTKEVVKYAPIVLFGSTSLVDNIETAYTDGINIRISPKFIDNLTDPELLFVILHEGMHIGLRHMKVWKALSAQNHTICNAACDYVINLILNDVSKTTDVIKFPRIKEGPEKGELFGLLDEKFRGWTVPQVFKHLLKECERQDTPNADAGNQPDSNNSAGTPSAPQGTGAGDPNTSQRAKDIATKQWDEHDFSKFENISEGQAQDIEQHINELIEQGAKLAGKMSADNPRSLADALRPEFSWEDALAHYIRTNMTSGKEKTTFRKFNRRLIGNELYMPSMYDDSIRKVVICCDTSGSIDNNLLRLFLGHIANICEEVNPNELVLLYWDTKIKTDERYSNEDFSKIMSSTKPRGGGGTDAACIPEYLRDNVDDIECVIVLTDGAFDSQGDWTDLPSPLWCITSSREYKKFVPMFGQSIEIKN